MVALTLLTAIATMTSGIYGASLQRVMNFGNNPTGAEMHIYVPDNRASNPPILVASHYCGGTAQAYYSGTQFARLADQYGFIVIYPDAPDSTNCWDVYTQQSLTHNGGGDSLAIVNMVKYALQQYSGNPSRVFATGSSSGAMMAQVLAGVYPDVFAGISSFAGVPFGCFHDGGLWNTRCAQGQYVKTGQEWGDMVRNAYPGYTGPRPKIQLWHGTNDEVLNYNNHVEAVKQWTNVLGVSGTPTATQNNSPVSGWTRSIYGPNMQAITAQGVTHNIPVQANDAIAFFGLNQAAPGPNPTTVPTSAPTSQPTQAPGPVVGKWGQCGGLGYTGSTTCVSGSTCVKLNDHYSQCQ